MLREPVWTLSECGSWHNPPRTGRARWEAPGPSRRTARPCLITAGCSTLCLPRKTRPKNQGRAVGLVKAEGLVPVRTDDTRPSAVPLLILACLCGGAPPNAGLTCPRICINRFSKEAIYTIYTRNRPARKQLLTEHLEIKLLIWFARSTEEYPDFYALIFIQRFLKMNFLFLITCGFFFFQLKNR